MFSHQNYLWRVMKLSLVVILLFLFQLSSSTATNPYFDDFSCPSTCGDVSIPYPFGIGDDCSLSGKFSLTCNNSYNPPRPFTGNVELTNITLDPPQVHAMMRLSYRCYNEHGQYENGSSRRLDLNESPYSFSYTENVFTAVGCDTMAFIQGREGRIYTGGCISMCQDRDSVINGSCSGIGCCQTSIPEGFRRYHINFTNTNNSQILGFYPCSYGFIVKKDNYTFHSSDLQNMDPSMKFPIILDWAIGSQTCSEAKNLTEYGCVAQYSDCRNSTNGPGYTCHCSKGFRGNPYIQEGCKDIDECQEGVACKGDCTNTIGSYNCTCPPGTIGNATGDGCTIEKSNVNEFSKGTKLGIGIGICLALIFIIGSLSFWTNEKRKLTKLREDFFRKNGGSFLQEQISTNRINTFRIFTMVEIDKATNKFDEQMILGRGGNAKVYKGFLNDGGIVAIKKSLMVEASKSKEFANEMLILSQINHVNVVKLIGCCLEVEVPILVYEYIPNGTLYELIHDERQDHLIPWSFRLKIGTESAKAIAYLHSEASPPILHGDIKSANILLGDDYITKVSDFGTSTLAPKDKSRFMTLIQGTYGYLDPMYLETGELTQKSDVYSFGVVMVELLTGKKAVYKDEFDREKNLVFEFKSCMKEGKLLEILDTQQIDVENASSSLGEINVVASVALRCLSVTGEERPTMSDVLRVLDGLKGSQEIGTLLDFKRQPIRNESPSMKSEIVTNIEMNHIGRGR